MPLVNYCAVPHQGVQVSYVNKNRKRTMRKKQIHRLQLFMLNLDEEFGGSILTCLPIIISVCFYSIRIICFLIHKISNNSSLRFESLLIFHDIYEET